MSETIIESEMIADATKALQAIILECQLLRTDAQVLRSDVRVLLGFLTQAQEIIHSAYKCPEWLVSYRTERTDETQWMVDDYLEEFGDE